MFRPLLLRHQGIRELSMYKTVITQYFNDLHVWKNWWSFTL